MSMSAYTWGSRPSLFAAPSASTPGQPFLHDDSFCFEGFYRGDDYNRDFQESTGLQYLAHLDRDYEKLRKRMDVSQLLNGCNFDAVAH